MTEYNPSKIIKDGNTYNFRDTTKIPLAGTNALSGSIIPDTDDAYNLGESTHGFNTIFTWYVQGSNAQKELTLFSSNNTNDPWNHGAFLSLFTNDYSHEPGRTGTFSLRAQGLGDNGCNLIGYPNGTLTWGSKNVAMQEDVIPRSGGVLGSTCKYTCNTTSSYVYIYSGTDWYNGAGIALNGGTFSNEPGVIDLQPCIGVDNRKKMQIRPNGTWTWDGTAVQLVSDQRFKQQITEIDDKLLDAWEDVDLVQFKYNDAVDQKGDNARLHTGYVVQQIDRACKSHGVDISAYGLYCHEEYPEETEEIEVEQADGTKTKERNVIREASEHYSLRYTECLVVECAYLRKKNKELQEQLDKLSARLDKLEGVQTK